MSNKPIYTEINMIKPERILKKEVKLDQEENAYENAKLENERIEFKFNNDRQRLAEFSRAVDERIRMYRLAKQKQEEIDNMKKLERINKIEILRNNIISKRSKSNTSVSKSARTENATPTSFFLNEKPIAHNNNHLIHDSPRLSLSTFEIIKNINEQRKARISMIRSAYGADEREKSKLKKTSHNNQQVSCSNHSKMRPSKSLINLTNDLLDMNLRDQILHSPPIQEPYCLEKPIKEKKIFGNSKDRNAIITKKPLSKKSVQPSMENTNKHIKYLWHLIKEKSNNVNIPPLCQCNIALAKSKSLKKEPNFLWNYDYNNCANNCLFYKNPKEYARVLIDLIGEEREKLDKFNDYYDNQILQN